MKNDKLVIWSNEYFPEDFEFQENDWESLSQYLDDWFVDEEINLNKDLPNGKYIVAFADMGLWHGRVAGAKMVGDNLKDIFTTGTSFDYVDFYADRYNVRATLKHHDGTHYVLFRVAKSKEEADRLVDRIACGRMTEKQFRKATRSLRPVVGKIYGWR